MFILGAQKSRPSKISLDPLFALSACAWTTRPSVPIATAISWMASISKSCGQPDRFRKFRSPLAHHSVQRLAPPVVGRNMQSRNGAGLVDELAGFFFESHPVHQVCGALFRWELGFMKGRLAASCAGAKAAKPAMQARPEATAKFLIASSHSPRERKSPIAMGRHSSTGVPAVCAQKFTLAYCTRDRRSVSLSRWLVGLGAQQVAEDVAFAR